MKILITGARGQLGSEFMHIAKAFKEHRFVFADREALDITNEKIVANSIQKYQPDFLINTAAYTAVDKAEEQADLAKSVNEQAPSYLAKHCFRLGCKLIHYSTDYVYNQSTNKPLTEDNEVNPSGIYAKTKLAGEHSIIKECPSSIIIRTSWVYSSFGNNFVKTMIRLGKGRDSLNIVNDQIGTPTYAKDIAITTMSLISNISHPNFNKYGVYNYSNEGVTNWADFAKTIFELEKIECEVYPISTKEYGAAADRPLWSVLSKDKIKRNFGIKIPHWETSLKKCLQELK